LQQGTATCPENGFGCPQPNPERLHADAEKNLTGVVAWVVYVYVAGRTLLILGATKRYEKILPDMLYHHHVYE
jgi:hypothetical protein